MPSYEVWATNDNGGWTQCLLETADKQAAIDKAQVTVDSGRFQWVAIDCDGRTIWSNDPETPAEQD